jgi:DUF1365 family protein
VRSCLYRGNVWHTRSRLSDASKPGYRFAYSVWYLGLDLAEREEVDARLRLLSRNGHNLTSWWDGDYLALSDLSLSSNPLRSRGEGLTASSGLTTQHVTMPRFLNYVFNPFSVLINRNILGDICGATAEVHNTWGERHLYNLTQAHPSTEGVYTSTVDKQFYVSPFISPEGRYQIELREDPATRRLRISIDESDDDGPFFQAGMDLTPLPLTDANLLRLLVQFPFVNLKTVAMIHWQGLKLWLRGEPFGRNPSSERRREAIEGPL